MRVTGKITNSLAAQNIHDDLFTTSNQTKKIGKQQTDKQKTSDKQAPRQSYQKNEEHRFAHQMTRHLGHSLMGNIKST